MVYMYLKSPGAEPDRALEPMRVLRLQFIAVRGLCLRSASQAEGNSHDRKKE
jgi:hypothetical protein